MMNYSISQHISMKNMCDLIYHHIISSYDDIDITNSHFSGLRIYNRLNQCDKIVIKFQIDFLIVIYFTLDHCEPYEYIICYNDPSMFNKLDKHITNMHYVKNA